RDADRASKAGAGSHSSLAGQGRGIGGECGTESEDRTGVTPRADSKRQYRVRLRRGTWPHREKIEACCIGDVMNSTLLPLRAQSPQHRLAGGLVLVGYEDHELGPQFVMASAFNSL